MQCQKRVTNLGAELADKFYRCMIMFDEKYYLDVYQDKENDELFDLFYRKGLADEARAALDKIFVARGIQPPSQKEKVEQYKNNILALNKLLDNRPRSIILGILLILIPALLGCVFTLLDDSPMLLPNIFFLLYGLLISYGVYFGRSWGLILAYKLTLVGYIAYVALTLIVMMSGLIQINEAIILRFLIFSILVTLLKLSLYYKSSKVWFQNCRNFRRLIKISEKEA